MVDRGRGIGKDDFLPFGTFLRDGPPQIDCPRQSRELPADFVPDKWSVICGRGREPHTHVGNRRLQVMVDCHADRYENATSKHSKSSIVTDIVTATRNGSQTGGFVKRDPKRGRWYEVGDDLAREKVGSALREAIAERNPAKYQTKRQRRKRDSLVKRANSAPLETQSHATKPSPEEAAVAATTITNASATVHRSQDNNHTTEDLVLEEYFESTFGSSSSI